MTRATLLLALGACGFRLGPATTLDAGGADASNDGGRRDVDVDAATIDGGRDAAIQDAPAPITLSETSPDVATGPGVGCATGFRRWYRVFPIDDPHFQVAGAFTIESAALWVWRAHAAPLATITVGTYAGAFNGPAFQPALFTQLEHADVALPEIPAGGHLVVATLTPVTVAAGSQVAIEIAAPIGGVLELGSIGNTGGWAHGFFLSDSCGLPGGQAAPATTSEFVVTVTGTP